ncbi:GNAT family N-acetyltransferase [Shewanella sp. YIC-542]|uniref:GNAT family N-acetyltransferase n=1 Tax=Shewanella mytili TaxID=3377111 RepID=UPI00398F656D
MKYALFNASHTQEVIRLFHGVFQASEGSASAQVMRDFVTRLIATTADDELIGCIATDDDCIVASIFFSRFDVPSQQVAFILSPVAVLTEVQRRGIGQQLIRYGLEHLRALNVELVFTYGDPAYYAKTGFMPLSEKQIKAPYPLTQPIGWQAQMLDGSPLQGMQGKTQCVAALDDPALW